MNELVQEVQELIGNNEVQLGDRLVDLGLDSLDFQELEFILNDHFKVELDSEVDLAQLTVGELVAYTESRRGTKVSWWKHLFGI